MLAMDISFGKSKARMPCAATPVWPDSDMIDSDILTVARGVEDVQDRHDIARFIGFVNDEVGQAVHGKLACPGHLSGATDFRKRQDEIVYGRPDARKNLVCVARTILSD